MGILSLSLPVRYHLKLQISMAKVWFRMVVPVPHSDGFV
jgi:hypothetical protein